MESQGLDLGELESLPEMAKSKKDLDYVQDTYDGNYE